MPKKSKKIETEAIVYNYVAPVEGQWGGAELVRLATFPYCMVCADETHVADVELETTVKETKVVSVTTYVSIHCNDGNCEWSGFEVPAAF